MFTRMIFIALLGLSIAPMPTCDEFINWRGGQPFDYQVDTSRNWNFPPETKIVRQVFFPNSGIQKYYSPRDPNAFYIIVYRTLDVIGNGQHDICVARVVVK